MSNPDPTATEEHDAPEAGREKLLADRRRKLDRLRSEFGIDPFGQRIDGLICLADARNAYDEQADKAFRGAEEDQRQAKKAGTPDDQLPIVQDNRPVVSVAGRVMQHRVMGNLIFMLLRDDTGDLQVGISKKAVGAEAFNIAKQTDLSDLVAARGALGKTNTGELTVWAQASLTEAGAEKRSAEAPDQSAGQRIDPLSNGFAFTTKSLALPPGKFHGLTDDETRYRKRYVDLHTNPTVMQTIQKRIAIIDAIRDYLRSKGFIEVETPMLQSLHGGAAARPFKTHHNALDIPLTLRIAPELFLKRLLVGGMRKVFEINRNFRNEGISPRHNPEFTMLEAYDAYGSWETMADLVEDMVCTVAEKVCGGLVIHHRDTEDSEKIIRTISLTRPWRRVSMVDLVQERTGWKFDKKPATQDHIDDLRARNPGKDLSFQGSPAEQLTEVFEKLIEPTLIDPTFVTRVPGVIIPLAKRCRDDDYFADVYELAINGVEISPGYTELNDPDEQERHFRAQVGDKDEQQQVDEDFLEALRVGMPPAGGIGLGIDRLVMTLTGAPSIRDVILFPLMRPQGRE